MARRTGARRQGSLTPLALNRALASPITSRLVVPFAGYGFGDQFSSQRGSPHAMVIVCVDGTGWARIAGNPHRVSAGTALVIPANVPHAYGPGPDPWTIWWTTVQGTEVADLMRSMDVTPQRPIIPVRSLEKVVPLIDEIISSYERDQSPARILEASGTAWKLMTRLSADLVLPAVGDPLARAMDHLSQRLTSDITVDELARFVGLSASHLTALFRSATGGGVIAYQIGLRMGEARRLLDGTHLAIREVGTRVGYRDPDYFSRHFRRLHGMSPSEYRFRHH